MSLKVRKSERRARRLIAFILPLLLLRLLIPTGFMLMAEEGGLSVTLCPGAADMPAPAAAHAAHHMHHAGRHGGADPPGAEHHAPCLFAASAAPPVGPATLRVVAPSTPATALRLPSQARDFVIPAIRRAQSPRAPPLRLLIA